ncbi:MAG: response regulator transcription factor [Chitinophagaceae bacterium]|nr:MAG: response regulator transcription factor [Chitinophagaceae bacterium]
MTAGKIRIAIADDHQIVVDGLRSVLSKYNQLEIVATANEGERMLSLLHTHPADVLLTDVMMPGMNGQQLAAAVKKTFPATRIIALSMSGQGDIVEEMINNADIAGYLLKQTSSDELAKAIMTVHSGGQFFADEILQQLKEQSEIKKQVAEIRLTQREIQIVEAIEKNLSNKEIAANFFISLHTVETHRKNIFRKTNTHSTLGLVKWAYEHKVLNKN